MFRRNRVEQELDDELRFHIEQATEAGVASGLAERDARRAAIRSIQGLEQRKEECRDSWGVRFVDEMRKDIASAIRQMRDHPGFTAAAVLSMALGIGANTVVFSVVHAVILRALPFPNSERLVIVASVPPGHPERRAESAVPDFVWWRDRNRVFDAIAAVNDVDRDLGADWNGAPAARIQGQLVTPSLFEITGVQPLLGRLYAEDEDRMDQDKAVALISYKLWNSRYNRDPNIVGKQIRLDSEVTTVIGVMPRGFNFFNSEADFWRPLPMKSIQMKGALRYIDTVARLKPGVTIGQAQTQLEIVARQLAISIPAHAKGWGVRVLPLREAELGDLWRPILMLQAIAGIVLLIACANVAGLLIARAGARAREIAVRAALGASRGRIVRQLLTESVLLSALGGVCGLALAAGGIRIAVALAPAWLPFIDQISLDGTVLACAAAASLATGIAFGAAPAWRTSKTDLAASMKEAGVSTGRQGPRSSRSRSLLVASQIALSLVLLCGAGLAMSSLYRMETIERGFDPEGLIGFQFRLPRVPYAKDTGVVSNGFALQKISPLTENIYSRILERLERVPGVVSAVGVSRPPLEGASMMRFSIEGRQPVNSSSGADETDAAWFFVTPGFFRTMRIPFIAGRDFDSRDTPAAPWSVIINEAMARLYWPNENPIGKRLTIEQGKDDRLREIIGVVRSMRTYRIEDKPAPAMYVLYTQQPEIIRGAYQPQRRNMTFVVRIAGQGAPIMSAIRKAVSELAPNQALTGMRPLKEYGGDAVEWPRYYAILLGLFAAMATVLASVGIYGLVAYAVERRTREIGIRMAMGATRRGITLLVLRQAFVLVAAGIVVGLGVSALLVRVIASVLWGATAAEPITFSAVCLMLAAVALIASWLPARRATRVDPNRALRYE